MIFAAGPVPQQIAIVRAIRIPGFTWDVGRHRPVPIAYIHDLPVGSAGGLLKPGAAGRINREPVTWTRDPASIQLGGFQRVLEIDLVQPPPLPALHVGAL